MFQRLFQKLEEERKALGGKLFDVLGNVTFDNEPLRDLLIKAIRYGNDPEVKDRLNQVVDNSINLEAFQKLIDERALTEDVMDITVVNRICEDMERMEAHKLQPHFIESFFLKAFRDLGGKIREHEKGRYEITSVPYAVRNRDMQIGYGRTVLKSYERVCFDKKYCNVQGKPQAEQLYPGHPLLEAVIDLVREENVDTMKRGAVFVDENDDSTEAKILFYIEDSIQDGVKSPNGKRRVLSKNIYFVEHKEDGSFSNAGYAPYLDYRAVSTEEQTVIRDWMKEQTWLSGDLKDQAESYAIQNLLPVHYEEVKKKREDSLNKTERAVKNRLTEEIQYWDYRAVELAQKERAGKNNIKLNSAMAKRSAEELAAKTFKEAE